LAEQNTQRAKDGYAAFMRGDIPAVLELLADDTEWVVPGPSDIPMAGAHQGKQAVLAFFGALGETLEFHIFEPRAFIAQGDTVVALIHADAIVRRTGRRSSRTRRTSGPSGMARSPASSSSRTPRRPWPPSAASRSPIEGG
jgi:ketosteroid isomerase-like protein